MSLILVLNQRLKTINFVIQKYYDIVQAEIEIYNINMRDYGYYCRNKKFNRNQQYRT